MPYFFWTPRIHQNFTMMVDCFAVFLLDGRSLVVEYCRCVRTDNISNIKGLNACTGGTESWMYTMHKRWSNLTNACDFFHQTKLCIVWTPNNAESTLFSLLYPWLTKNRDLYLWSALCLSARSTDTSPVWGWGLFK